MIVPFPLTQADQQMQRVLTAVEQHRNAPFRSADWLAGELMKICETGPANDAAHAPIGAGELPVDVRNLVIAGREFWEANDDSSEEARAMLTALEAFSSRVPYEDEPEVRS